MRRFAEKVIIRLSPKRASIWSVNQQRSDSISYHIIDISAMSRRKVLFSGWRVHELYC
jgi:hypothetical protein